jgi:hypothetical protein
MSNAQDLRALLTAKVVAMPLGMLMQAADALDAKPDRDEAERRVMVELAVELGKRLREMAKQHSTESLIADLRGYMAADYKTATKSQREAHWATSSELERRYPAALAAVEQWMDGIDIATSEAGSYDAKLLELITAERVQAAKDRASATIVDWL